MSDKVLEQGDVNWKAVMTRLSQGMYVEIPCENEREIDRRMTQFIKRAEKLKLKVEILRGERSLRIEPPIFPVVEATGSTRRTGVKKRKKKKQARAKSRKAASANAKTAAVAEE